MINDVKSEIAAPTDAKTELTVILFKVNSKLSDSRSLVPNSTESIPPLMFKLLRNSKFHHIDLGYNILLKQH